MIEVGELGLRRAIVGCEVGYSTRLSTYASPWTRQAIQREDKTHSNVLLHAGLPVQAGVGLQPRRGRMMVEAGFEPRDHEVFDRLGWDAKTITSYRDFERGIPDNLVASDAVTGDNNDHDWRGSIYEFPDPCAGGLGAFEQVQAGESLARWPVEIEQLDGRTRTILSDAQRAGAVRPRAHARRDRRRPW
ncbi:hypothetical protein, partial [Singulisphaera acidiphila]|uniref:hypothetical protein n=1 Tax=Singulisphaera acidiphila TaxID=466153 RepID=UPI00037A26B4